MTTLSQQIPQVGVSDATEDVKIANNFTTLTTWANGNIDGANVVASLTGRRMIGYAVAFVPAATATGNYFVNADGTLTASGANSTKGIHWWSLDTATWAVAGKSNTTITLRIQACANGTAPGASCNVGGQLSMLSFGGATGNIVPTVGTLVASGGFGVGGLGPVTPSQAETTPVAIPPNFVAPLVTIAGAATAANSAITITLQLFVYNT